MAPSAGNIGENQGGVSVSAAADLSQKLALSNTFGNIGGPQINASAAPPPGFFNSPDSTNIPTNKTAVLIVGIIALAVVFVYLRR